MSHLPRLISNSNGLKPNEESLPLINRRDLFLKARDLVNKSTEITKVTNLNKKPLPMQKDKASERLKRNINDEKNKAFGRLNEIHITNSNENHEQSAVNNWNEINAKLNMIERQFIITSSDNYAQKRKVNLKTNSKIKGYQLNNSYNNSPTNNSNNDKVNSNFKLVVIDLCKAFVNNDKEKQQHRHHEHYHPSCNSFNYEHQTSLTKTDRVLNRQKHVHYKASTNNKLKLNIEKRD